MQGFEDEGEAPMGILVGKGSQGRYFTDLAALGPSDDALAAERFFIRTRAPAGLATLENWFIRIVGLKASQTATPALALRNLAPLSSPRGVVCMECAGNDPGGRFGLLSAAHWTGISWTDFLSTLGTLGKRPPAARMVRFRGATSEDGRIVDWTFPMEHLADAFLATGMAGKPLAADHGGPVRLMVPGWYGCACIKWVEEVAFLDDSAPSTEHMRDYAGRTHQEGVPELAREYAPARIGLSALPVRLESFSDGKDRRLIGLAWGGVRAEEVLQIQTGDLDWQDTEVLARRGNSWGWSLWSHTWKPRSAGIFQVTLRPKDPATRATRLRSGYYARAIRIDRV